MAKISLYIFNIISFLSFWVICIKDIRLPAGLISYFFIFLTILFFAVLPVDFKKKSRKLIKVNLLDIFILLYIVWNLLTVINVIIFGNLVVYLKGVSYTVFPISGYFFLSFSRLDQYRDNVDGFLQVFLNFLLVTIAFGAFLIIARPEYYVQYLVNKIDSPWASQYLRMTSYFDNSSIVGNICAISFPIVFYLTERKRLKGPLFLYVIFLLLGLILSFARGAWLIGLFSLLLLIILRLRPRSIVLYFTGFVLLISVGLAFYSSSFFMNELTKKIDRIPDAFAERSDQIKYGLNSIVENAYGAGLGQMGHKSQNIQGDKPGVYDNNYIRIASELGIPGFSLFLIVSFVSFLYIFYLFVVRHFEKLFVMTIGLTIFEFYVQALGTNVFDYFYSSFIFWSLLGAVSLVYKVSYKKVNKSNI